MRSCSFICFSRVFCQIWIWFSDHWNWMFHLIFPFTQSTSNWCQLLAAVGLLYAALPAGRLPDATRTWLTGAARSAAIRLRLPFGLGSLVFVSIFFWVARAPQVKLRASWLAVGSEARQLFWFFTELLGERGEWAKGVGCWCRLTTSHVVNAAVASYSLFLFLIYFGCFCFLFFVDSPLLESLLLLFW